MEKKLYHHLIGLDNKILKWWLAEDIQKTIKEIKYIFNNKFDTKEFVKSF